MAKNAKIIGLKVDLAKLLSSIDANIWEILEALADGVGSTACDNSIASIIYDAADRVQKLEDALAEEPIEIVGVPSPPKAT